MHIADITHAARAGKLVRAYHGATSKTEHFKPLMTALFDLFGVSLLSVAQFDSAVRDSRYYDGYAGFIDLLCPGVLLVHAGDAGADLDALLQVAHRQIDALPQHDCPNHVLVTDLQRFRLYASQRWRRSDTSAVYITWSLAREFGLAELAENIGAFSFITSIPSVTPRNLPEKATKATARLLAKFRADLLATKYPEADVDSYVIKLLLILCMDQNGTYARGSFYRLILGCTCEDGSDVGERIEWVFRALGTREAERQVSMSTEAQAFPYVDVATFEGRRKIAHFSPELRLQLLELIACNWRDVSLELIGVFYQESVANSRDQRRRGWYYISEVFSLPVLQPLFLSELQQTFQQIRHRRVSEQPAQFNVLWDHLANITVLDPACGSGYFLTAAYSVLRALETAIIVELLRLGSKPPGAGRSRLTVGQMVGIESDPTAAQIARASLLLAGQRANCELSICTGRHFARLPLSPDPPSVHCRDALAIDWVTFLPPERCSYIVGNAPYGGATPVRQGAADAAVALQRKRLRKVEQQFSVDLSRLDFAAAWLVKAGDMVRRSEGRTRVGFVVTGSLTQGEQVCELWPILFDRYRLDILFARRPVSWSLGDAQN